MNVSRNELLIRLARMVAPIRQPKTHPIPQLDLTRYGVYKPLPKPPSKW